MTIKEVWERWKKLAEKIGNFQIRLVFSILYFLIISPLGLISSLFADFLSIKSFPVWRKLDNQSLNLEQMKEL